MPIGMKNKKATGNMDIPAEDNYLARVVAIVNLDHQPAFTLPNGDEVESQYKVALTYELPTSLTEDGRPHWVSEDMKQSDHERAKLYARVRAIDPRGELTNKGQDIAGLINAPCMVSVRHNDKGYPIISNVTSCPSGFEVPALQNKPYVFDFEEPDMEVYERLPMFVRTKIKSSLNYEGSPLQVLVEELEKEQQNSQY